MKPTSVTSLAQIPIAITPSATVAAPFRPRGGFKLPIVLAIAGGHELGWSKENALNLSYRWYDETGNCIEREGRRTTLPVDRLIPGARVEVDLAGSTPDECGVYQLTVSLVLEGVEWACDRGPSGWTQIAVPVTLGPAWPTELRTSIGGRALRGALVAAELSRSVATRHMVEEIPGKDTLGHVAGAGARLTAVVTRSSMTFGDKLRTRLRRAIGIDDLHDQLETLLSMANRQERHANALETEIQLLKEELRSEPGPSEAPQPSFEQEMLDTSSRLKKLAQRPKAATTQSSSRRATSGAVARKSSPRGAGSVKSGQ